MKPSRANRGDLLGLRLRIADVAAGLRLPRAAPRPAGRRPPRAMRLFLRASRHAGEARPGARARPRRQLPRHRLPGRGRQARRNHRLSARARTGDAWSIAKPGARSGSTTTRSSSVQALCYMVDRGHRQYAGRLPSPKQLHFVRQGHGRSGNNRDYVLARSRRSRRIGYRDARAANLLAAQRRAQGTHVRSASELLSAFRDQARGRRSRSSSCSALEEHVLVEPGHDRIENLDHHRSRLSAGPCGAARTAPELSATGRHGTPAAA